MKHIRSFSATLLAMLAAGTAVAQRPVPTEVSQPIPAAAIPVGPPPSRVSVSGTPALARVSWGSVGASSYLVQRWSRSNPKCCRVSSQLLGERATGWEDPLPAEGGTYAYRVTASYSDGRQGFAEVSYVRPEPTNPSVLTPTIANPYGILYPTCPPGATGWGPMCYYTVPVRLTWTEVSGAAYYIVSGPGVLPTTGFQTDQTSVVVTSNPTSKIPWGMNTWTVAAFFLPGPIGTDPANITKGSLNIPDPGPKP